jgi:hypothetical protein
MSFICWICKQKYVETTLLRNKKTEFNTLNTILGIFINIIRISN